MKTFDYEQASEVLRPLKAKFSDCTHGEGDECMMLDKQLECCAKICSALADAIRNWALGVFSGEVVFDPSAEKLLRSEVSRIYAKATMVWQLGRKAEVPCWELDGQAMLATALFELHWLLEKWVTPKVSVGPSARLNLNLTDEQRAAIKRQLDQM